MMRPMKLLPPVPALARRDRQNGTNAQRRVAAALTR